MEKNITMQRTIEAKLLLVLSAICGIGIAPLIFFRVMQRDWRMVVLDVFIVIGVAIVFFYVYRTNKTKYPSLFFLLIAQIGSVFSFYINGGHMINWIYPAMLTTFFVSKPRHSLYINFVILLIYLPKLFTYFETIEIVIIVISCSISNIIAFRFTQSLRLQTKELKTMASEDYLTSAGNRRALNLILNKIWIDLQKHPINVSLIILDIDHFKKVNDVFGHLIGDKILVKLSQFIKLKLSSNDKLYRYGGEEFLMVCTGKDVEQSYVLAQEIRKEIKHTQFIDETKITISLGVAQYLKGEAVTDWIHRVDNALYQAKNQGRDRVIKA